MRGREGIRVGKLVSSVLPTYYEGNWNKIVFISLFATACYKSQIVLPPNDLALEQTN